jgi:transcriptional regulator with XRE-family HTH domain
MGWRCIRALAAVAGAHAIVVDMTAATITTDAVRERREQLGLSRLSLAVRAGVSVTWLAAIEAGLRPRGAALDRVEAALNELERGERFVPFANVRDHLELGPPASDGPEAA